MGKFEIFKGKNQQYYFHLKAENGQIIAQSEGYSTKQGAENGVEAVRRCAPAAKVVDLSN